MPRNVHKSVINALVLCGAIPVYVNPEMDNRLGISLGMQVSEVEKAILEHPKAVAVLVNNPTYYGICSDLRSIVKVAHAHGMKVLVDEAHGTHLYFGEKSSSLCDGCRSRYGLSLHAQIRRKPDAKLHPFNRKERKLGVCQSDY